MEQKKAGVTSKGQSTLFGSPKDALLNLIEGYPQVEYLKPPIKELKRDKIREIMVKIKDQDMAREHFTMYSENDGRITGEELKTGKISIKEVEAASFLGEHKRTSMAECKGFIQDSYIVYCNSTKIGLINFSNSMMKNEERAGLFEDGKGVNDYKGKNIQTCVSYPWAGPFMVGKLLATISCALGRLEGLDFVETTSLFGKSIQYDRLPFLRMLGYTTGSTGATYLFPHEFFQKLQKLMRTFYTGYLVDDDYFSKKKSLLHAFLRITGLEAKGYEPKNVVIKRGYYLSILSPKLKDYCPERLPPATVEEAVEYWRTRWLSKKCGGNE